jgi:hypothetical protein
MLTKKFKIIEGTAFKRTVKLGSIPKCNICKAYRNEQCLSIDLGINCDIVNAPIYGICRSTGVVVYVV